MKHYKNYRYRLCKEIGSMIISSFKYTKRAFDPTLHSRLKMIITWADINRFRLWNVLGSILIGILNSRKERPWIYTAWSFVREKVLFKVDADFWSETILSCLIWVVVIHTINETWFQHFTTDTKRLSSSRKHINQYFETRML